MSSGRVLVTRATEDAAELLAALARRGFVGVSLPLLEYAIGPDEPIMPREGWLLLTSPRAAQRLPQVRSHPSTRIAVVGERTGSVVRERGYEVARVAADSARSLADLLKEESGPFTWWCGDRALPDL
ncbi:MAG TPA: uroporphyrinogen-III synthase, partial [Planctomycetota bacterium]|nr:uroporphyrinogen-III synthase [Planctomycetota bacterium]